MAEITPAAITRPGAIRNTINVATPVRGGLPNAINVVTVLRNPVRFYYDFDSGTYTLSGNVKALALPANMPMRRKVQLIEQKSGRVIRETWSDAATGDYSFTQIAGGRVYTVVSFDHEGVYRAVVADNLTPS